VRKQGVKMRKAGLTIVLSGMMAGDPHQGGATWAVLQYLLGFQRLGHKVTFVEPLKPACIRPAGATLEDSENTAYFRRVVTAFGLEDVAALLLEGTRTTVGLPYDRLCAAARRADVLVNISGMLTDPELLDPIPVRVYLDLDPAFVQLWHAVSGIDMRFTGHTHFVTVGQAIGQAGCTVPTCGRRWIPTLQPIVLDHWPVADAITFDGLTTVGNWRGYGSIEYDGAFYGQRVHSLRQLIDLPRRTDVKIMPALAIHSGETSDLEALRTHGWDLLDPMHVADTPEHYRRFIQRSWAELGIAKSGYVASRCGWFSDRSACYLASGRPVLAQDTGFGAFLPVGAGLLAFRDLAEVLAGLDSLRQDYARHARAARELAREFFDSDKVLKRLLEQVGGGK
jgi:hypothetical protein